MSNTIFWLALTAYILHILEEFFYNWKDWAQHTLKLPVNWTDFYIVNISVVFLGIACASVGWNHPIFSLAYPGLMLINAIFFHILPVIIKKKFSPGVITACLLFLPLCYTAFKQALEMGVSVTTILAATGEGMLLMVYPVILLKTKDLPFFRQ